ncbi:glutamyl-tRNA(Gln) amidotransferase C subunit [Clostridium sp. CAG:1000]|nr:glutamyl-tRNA(Gln) amidotransferase C subunit [Clostridium sp. CAG:1000]
MSNFTKEMIDDYADKLLIGLTEEERTNIQEEFDEIEKNMDLINQISNIKDTEPLSYPFEMIIDDLRSDDEVMEEIPIEELLRNCDQYEGREVEVPKVVG